MQRAYINIIVVIFSSILLIPDSKARAGAITVDGACTLIDAIIAANTDSPEGNCQEGSGPDTITLNVDVSLTEAYVSSSILFAAQAGLPDITSDITIQAGSGNIISGNSSSFRLFNVAAGGSLTLDGIVVTGGRVVGDNSSVGGGAFYVSPGRTLTLINSTVQNNYAVHTNSEVNGRGAAGGAIYSQGTVTLQNTTMSNNTAEGGDGKFGGFASGGAIYNQDNLTIIGSEFRDNQALGGLGTDGSRPATGGAIANFATIDTITESTFHNNLAHGLGKDGITGYEASSGGALFNASNVVEISGSTFSANRVLTTTPGEKATGGAIFNRLLFGTVTNSTFSSNSSQNSGGSTASGGAFYTTSGTPSFTHVTFLNNSGDTNGADLYLVGGTTVTVNSSILAGSASGENCTVPSGVLTGSNNLTDDASCSSIQVAPITVDTHIESVLTDNGGLTKTHALIDVAGNPAVDGNPDCGLITDQRGEMRDANCDIGSYELQPAVETPTPTDTDPPPTDTATATFTSTNTDLPPTDPTIPPTDTLTFTATNTDVPPTDTPTPTLTPTATATPTLPPQDIVVDGTCTLVDAINAANTDMAVGSCPAGDGADTIFLDINTLLTQAYSPMTPTYGGRAGLPEITSDITIEARLGNLISGNSTDFRIFYIDPTGTLTLKGVTVSNGRIMTSNEEGRGGGLLNDGSLTLLNTIITGNMVESESSSSSASQQTSGGGLYNSGTLIVDLSIISNNTLRTGTSTVSGGTAQGAAIASGGIMTITDSTIQLNHAEGGDGVAGGNAYGALFLENGSDTTIIRSTIATNTVDGGFALSSTDSGHGQGGGIYLNTSAKLEASNSTIYGNQVAGGGHAEATGIGGGIFSSSGKVNLDHLTLINNLASTRGDAILTTDLALSVNHSIIASPGGSDDCAGVHTGSDNLTVDSTCASVSSGPILPGIHVDPTLNANGGPTLTNALLPVVHNPAIDGNMSCTYSIDQRGVPRIGGCDIGAFELEATNPTPTPTVPSPTPTVPSLTPTPPTPTATNIPTFLATAECIHPNLIVTIISGDGPFRISASAGINLPVTFSSLNDPKTVYGPEKWDNLTVTDLAGDSKSINLGKFKCRPLEIPVPLTPEHRLRTYNRSPVFSWTPIPDANRYRVFLFDHKKASERTVDRRQNSVGSATSLIFKDPLPIGRLFWRVRGRVNRVWGFWSIRFTLFIDLMPVQSVQTPLPTVGLPPTMVPVPTGLAPPNSR